MLPLIFWLYRQRINFQAACGALVGLVLVVAVVAIAIDPERLGRFRGEAVDDALRGRMERARMTAAGFLASPILGNGTADTSVQLKGETGEEGYPHNQLLEVANELGVLGLAAWLTIVLSAVHGGMQLGRPEWEGTLAKDVGVPIFVGCVYLLINSFKGGSFAHAYMTYFYMIATIVLAELRKRDLAAWQARVWATRPLRQASANLVDHVPARSLADGRILDGRGGKGVSSRLG